MKTKNHGHKLLDSIFAFFLLLSTITFLVLSVFIIILKYKEFAVKVHDVYAIQLDQQKNQIKRRLESIKKLALFQKEQHDIPVSARNTLLRYISTIRFGKNENGYIYIVQKSNGRVLMHPVSPYTVGKDVRTIYDPEGINVGEELYKVINAQDKGFFHYAWMQPSTGKIVPKIGYACVLPEYDWILATGVYVNDINSEISAYRHQLKKTIFWNTQAILSALVVSLIVFGGFLSFVKRRFRRDMLHVSEYFKKAATSGEKINTNILSFRELQDLGKYLNIIVEKNHRMYKSLKILADYDSLTGLLNRRKFLEHLEREFSLCKRYNHCISLLMIDLDHFKNVNDTYGHNAGDNVLKLFSKLCTHSIRDVDIAGRIGGEEFAVLMPSTEKESALVVAERIRNAIAEETIEYEGKKFSITISIGLASIPPEKLENAIALLKVADRLLYEAKESGRNRVCS